MLILFYTVSNTNGDCVLTLYKLKLQAGHINTDKKVVVTNFECIVISCPTIGMVDNLLVCSAFVNYKLSATGLAILDSVVNCYVVQTSFLYVESQNDRVGSRLVIAINVRIRKHTVTCTHFIIFHMCAGGIVECIQPDYIFACELFGKSCGEVEYIGHSIAIVIEGGSNFDNLKFVVAVYALAALDRVLVIVVYVTANSANAPSVVKSCRVVEKIDFVAMSIFTINLDFFSENKIQISEVLILFYTVSNTNGDCVLTLYKFKLQAGHISTDKKVVVTNFPYFVNR